jgi:hypothetical protein
MGGGSSKMSAELKEELAQNKTVFSGAFNNTINQKLS